MQNLFSGPTGILAIGALVIFVIARQLMPAQLSGRRLLLFPAIAAYGVVQTSPSLARLDLLGIGMLVFGGAVGLVFGALRGLTVRIWQAADGSTWTRGTWLTLALWVAMILVRIGTTAADYLLGIDTKALTGELMVFMLLTFGAQNAVVWLRAQSRLATIAA